MNTFLRLSRLFPCFSQQRRFGTLLLSTLAFLLPELAHGDTRYESLIESLLSKEARSLWPAAEIHVDVQIDPRLNLSSCVAPDVQIRGQQRHGRVHVSLRCGNPRAWSVNIPANVLVHTPVLVASRAMARGEVPGLSNVREERRLLQRTGRDVLLPGHTLQGLVVKRTIPAGTVLTMAHFSSLPAIRAGETVRLLTESGPIRIETQGKALEEGRMGEQINVENVTSGRKVRGWVTGAGQVSTRYGAEQRALASPIRRSKASRTPDLVALTVTKQ